MSTTGRVLSGLVMVLTLGEGSNVTSFLESARAMQPAAHAEAKPDKQVDSCGKSWRLLDFLDQGDAGGRRIVKLRLTTRAKRFEHLFPIPANAGLESTDKEFLAQVGSALTWAKRQVLIRESSPFSGTSFARLHVTTNKEKFVVGISASGFVLDEDKPSIANTFYSWTLAKTIDDWCIEKTGKGLRPELFEELSGEKELRVAKEDYKRQRRDRQKK